MSNGRYLRPCDGNIHSRAGYRPGVGLFDYHYGLDMGEWNWAVRSMYNGRVASIVRHAADDWRVNVRHPDGQLSRYIHLLTVGVSVGQWLGQSSIDDRFIGRVGLRRAPHVHVEWHPGGVWRGNNSASMAGINSLIVGTPSDGSSNPRNWPSSSAPASSTIPTPTPARPKGLTVSEANRIRNELSVLIRERSDRSRDQLAALIRDRTDRNREQLASLVRSETDRLIDHLDQILDEKEG